MNDILKQARMPLAFLTGINGATVLAVAAFAAAFFIGQGIFEGLMSPFAGDDPNVPNPIRGFLAFPVYLVLVFACCAAAAWTFRECLRITLPEIGAKPMRHAPLTASFGMVVIYIYVALALFSPIFAPYGEADIFDRFNALPGDDPRFMLGTDQIGRDILTRLIYGEMFAYPKDNVRFLAIDSLPGAIQVIT